MNSDMKKSWINEPLLNFKIRAISLYVNVWNDKVKKEVSLLDKEDCKFIDKITRGKLWQRAIFWYQKAAVKDEAFAVKTMKRIESFKSTKRKARDGDADAQYLTALYYFHAYGIYKDLSEGCKWMRKAILNGSREALQSLDEWNRNNPFDDKYELIDFELVELGMEEDYIFLPPLIIPEGLDLRPFHMDCRHGMMKWRFASDNNTDILWHAFSELDFGETLKAAEEGNAEKQYQLAWLYEWGKGGTQDAQRIQDNQKAVEWLVKSAYNGYTPAQTELGILYQYRICASDFSLIESRSIDYPTK